MENAPMISLMILAVVTLYLCFAHMSYKYMDNVNVSYFGESVEEDVILLSIIWPISLVIFLNIYAVPLKAVAIGKDWADLNIEDESRRIDFREHCMRKVLPV